MSRSPKRHAFQACLSSFGLGFVYLFTDRVRYQLSFWEFRAKPHAKHTSRGVILTLEFVLLICVLNFSAVALKWHVCLNKRQTRKDGRLSVLQKLPCLLSLYLCCLKTLSWLIHKYNTQSKDDLHMPLLGQFGVTTYYLWLHEWHSLWLCLDKLNSLNFSPFFFCDFSAVITAALARGWRLHVWFHRALAKKKSRHRANYRSCSRGLRI